MYTIFEKWSESKELFREWQFLFRYFLLATWSNTFRFITVLLDYLYSEYTNNTIVLLDDIVLMNYLYTVG